MNKYDYTGKTIFVGIDVHKKTYSVSVICDGALTKRDTMSADPEKLVTYLKKYFCGAIIKSAYEAGFSGFGLHRYLVKNEIENIVVNAASIEVGARDRVKTDKRDSLKIAVQLSAGRLTGIYVPSPEMEDRRALTRLRATFVKDRNRIAVRLKSKANYYGLIGSDDNQKVSKAWINKIKEKKMMPGLRYTINEMIEQWEDLNRRIKNVEEVLEEQSVADEKLEVVFRSVCGVGKTSARVLANELGDMSQFKSERALFSYTGLTPAEYSSGEHVRKGHITGQGRSILRSILVQCAWTAIRYDDDLRESYLRISSHAGVKRAIVAVARKLLGRIRACFRKRELYVIGYLKVSRESSAKQEGPLAQLSPAA
jgi:transposase